MSSVLIKGMKMPKNNGFVKVWIYPDGGVYYEVGECNDAFKSQAVEIKTPHGRLIDADQLEIVRGEFTTYLDYSVAFDIVDNAPTVIESENE